MNNKEKRKDECPICLSKIRTEAYLDSCTHVFCKKCIKKWSEVLLLLCRIKIHARYARLGLTKLVEESEGGNL